MKINGGTTALLAPPEVERLLASVREEVAQLQKHHDELARTAEKLEKELAAEKIANQELQVERDKYKELARAFIEADDPMERVIEDFKNYPPLEQCHLASAVLAELELADKEREANKEG